MTAVFTLPLLLPLLAAVSARWIANRLEPRTAAWLLTGSALVLAMASGAALTLLAVSIVWLVPLAVAVHWPAAAMSRYGPTSLVLALLACPALGVAAGAAVVTAARRVRALAAAVWAARRLPGGAQLAVLDDPVPDAYAVPGLPGRIVVTAGMLGALDQRERAVLLAHERAHLTGGHWLFVALAQLAAAANPLLRPIAAAVRFSVERWADERAARVTGDRRLVARTIGKAALLTAGQHRRPSAVLAVAAGIPRSAGPVPRRVAALLGEPPRRHPLLLAATLAVLVLAVGTTLVTGFDLHAILELAGGV